MKRIKHHYIIYLITAIILTFYSCKKNNGFIDPEAKFNISNTSFAVMEKVEITNLGKGEYFSFWPGDQGHNYAMKSMGGNIGLTPNVGKDLVYYYPKAGVYTVVMLASSYDGETNKYIQKIDSVSITVSGGSPLNYFKNFGIYHAWEFYSPEGKIKNDSISINIAPVNRPTYKDSLFAYIINGRPPLFSVAGNSSDVSVYDENNTLLKGDGTDPVKMKVFKIIDPNTVEPIIKTYKVVNNITQDVHSYKVAAMFYPQLLSFAVGADNAIMFSPNGSSVPNSDQISAYLASRPDSIFVGVFLTHGQNITSVTPTFSVTPGSEVTLNGIVQTSGVSNVDFTKTPIVYEISKKYNGFKITTKFAVNYSVF
jgi:hypothetical protein